MRPISAARPWIDLCTKNPPGPKTHLFFFPILPVFAPLNDVRAYRDCLVLKNNPNYVNFFTRMISNLKYKCPPPPGLSLSRRYHKHKRKKIFLRVNTKQNATWVGLVIHDIPDSGRIWLIQELKCLPKTKLIPSLHRSATGETIAHGRIIVTKCLNGLTKRLNWMTRKLNWLYKVHVFDRTKLISEVNEFER